MKSIKSVKFNGENAWQLESDESIIRFIEAEEEIFEYENIQFTDHYLTNPLPDRGYSLQFAAIESDNTPDSNLTTDLYSRKIVGYDISDSLELAGCLRALKSASQLLEKPNQHLD